MGVLDGIELGRLLWRGAWNSQSYGPLQPLRVAGEKAGTDMLFHKSKRLALCLHMFSTLVELIRF